MYRIAISQRLRYRHGLTAGISLAANTGNAKMSYLGKPLEPLNITVAAEWSEVGADAISLSYYWTRKQCRLIGVAPTSDMAAECRLRAIENYTRRRETERPVSIVAMVQSALRNAARRAVDVELDGRRIGWGDDVDILTVEERTDDDGDASRLGVVLAALPRDLAAAALAAAEVGSEAVMSAPVRAVGERLGVSYATASRRLVELRSSSALAWLQAQHLLDSGRTAEGRRIAADAELSDRVAQIVRHAAIVCGVDVDAELSAAS